MGKIYKGDDLSKKKLDRKRDGSKYEEWEKKNRDDKKKKK
jgi:hypothetical protein